MRASAIVGVFGTALVVASAAEFPLTLRTMLPQEAMSCPGGYGGYGQLETKKPLSLKTEPKPISGHPLYGNLRVQGKSIVFRLDESRGEGKGYDQILLDLNRNDDLTDDPLGTIAPGSNSPERQSSGYERAIFGPILAPASLAVGQWKPRIFAEMYLFNREFRTMGNQPGMFIGQLRVRAGCYLEANVDLDGVKQRIGIVDANCNFRLGELTKAQKNTSPDGVAWYFTDADSLLRDWNNSGKFESDQFDGEAEAIGKYVYFGSNPYRLTLDAAFASVRLEPYTEPLGELAFGPHGDQIGRITLGRETGPDQWEPVIPTVIAGKARVPVGNYRLFSCQVAGKARDGAMVMAGGYKRAQQGSTKVQAGEMTAMKCGAPLDLQVTANKQPGGGRAGGGLMAAAISLFSGSGSSNPPELRINMTVTGAGGESYSGYTRVRSNNRANDEMPRPTYLISDADGKQLASGNLEFG